MSGTGPKAPQRADLHVVPIGDLIDHESNVNKTCVCGPTDTPVKLDDGSVRWLAVHHSLDGCELPPSVA